MAPTKVIEIVEAEQNFEIAYFAGIFCFSKECPMSITNALPIIKLASSPTNPVFFFL